MTNQMSSNLFVAPPAMCDDAPVSMPNTSCARSTSWMNECVAFDRSTHLQQIFDGKLFSLDICICIYEEITFVYWFSITKVIRFVCVYIFTLIGKKLFMFVSNVFSCSRNRSIALSVNFAHNRHCFDMMIDLLLPVFLYSF